jgi:hypothetical protein
MQLHVYDYHVSENPNLCRSTSWEIDTASASSANNNLDPGLSLFLTALRTYRLKHRVVPTKTQVPAQARSHTLHIAYILRPWLAVYMHLVMNRWLLIEPNRVRCLASFVLRVFRCSLRFSSFVLQLAVPFVIHLPICRAAVLSFWKGMITCTETFLVQNANSSRTTTNTFKLDQPWKNEDLRNHEKTWNTLVFCALPFPNLLHA